MPIGDDLDRGLARKMEPRCPTPARRLKAIRALSDAGVQTGVMAAPMIPVLNDPELESIQKWHQARARPSPAATCCCDSPLETAICFANGLKLTHR